MTDGMSNHYPQRQITEIQLRYVTINQTLTELFYYLNLLRHTSVYYLQNNFFLSFCTSKGGFTMKARSFKKFFVSIALSAVLTLSSASSVFAATAQLVPAEQTAWNRLKVTILTPLPLNHPMHRMPALLLLPNQGSARQQLPRIL